MKRRKARELALAFLYQMEIRDEIDGFSDDILTEFLTEQEIEDEEIAGFTRILVKGTIQNLPFIDKKLSECSINWSLKRMPYIDRNILRIAAYELLFLDTVPVLVSINEAIEMAKKYSSKDSSKFVNGVLHRLKEEYARKKNVTPLMEDEKK